MVVILITLFKLNQNSSSHEYYSLRDDSVRHFLLYTHIPNRSSLVFIEFKRVRNGLFSIKIIEEGISYLKK